MKEDNQITKEAARKPDVKIEISVEITGEDVDIEKAKERVGCGWVFLLLMSAACIIAAVFDLVNIFCVLILIWGVAFGVWYYLTLEVWRKEGGSFPWWWGGL